MSVVAPVRNLTAELLKDVSGVHRALVMCTEPGIVAGLELLDPEAAPVPVGRWHLLCGEGDSLRAGDPLLEVVGTAAELGNAEDHVVGHLGFAGGVATLAREVVRSAPHGLALVCGGWKKLPAALKPALRAGLDVAGVRPRLLPGDFVYVPKNSVRLLGGLREAVEAGVALGHGPVAVQIADAAGAEEALEAGAGALMVDTGRTRDLAAVNAALRDWGRRDEVTLGFGGGASPEWLSEVRQAGADVVDIGRALLNAPLWDLRMEVMG